MTKDPSHSEKLCQRNAGILGYGQEHLNHNTHIPLWGLMVVPSVASL